MTRRVPPYCGRVAADAVVAAIVAAINDMINYTIIGAHRSLWLMQCCRGRREQPSFARLGRARAPVPTRADAGLVAARNRYSIGLIPSCVFSSYYCCCAIAGAFRPQRYDSPIELYR